MTNRFRHLSSPNLFDLERQSSSEQKLRNRIWYGIWSPGCSFLEKWNKFILFACALSISLDPLFFYIPVIDRNNVCLKLDKKLVTTACVLRTIIDVFYIFRIIFQFRTGRVLSTSRGSVIANTYLASHFIVDVLSILPLPQTVVLVIIRNQSSLASLVKRSIMEIVIFVQYVPRFMRIYPLYKELTSTSGMITQTAWAGAVSNLVLYLLASQIVGAVWYILSIERGVTCWHEACKLNNSCMSSNLYCGGHKNDTYSYMLDHCAFIESEEITNLTQFNFGIFAEALASGVADSTHFPQKFLYCFWWGLRSVSSLGQNLKTSTVAPEVLFAISISIAGLVLFALFIGNMQKYLQFLQSTTERVQEMRVKTRDTERWMSHHELPCTIRERIRQYEKYNWQKTRGVEEQALIRSFPKDIRRDINRHLCFSLIKRVPLFEKLDEQILYALCDCLKPVVYSTESCIIQQGAPLDEMLFITKGFLESVTTDGRKKGSYSVSFLKPGDFIGESLLIWALDPGSSSMLPTATSTLKTQTAVEAFALVAEDLKSVASQFRLYSDYNKQTLFRYYSLEWRVWASGFIQSAWRRYWKKKRAKLLQSLVEEELQLQHDLANEVASLPSLGATLYAASFAAKALRVPRQYGARPGKPPQRMQPLPSKPSLFIPHHISGT